MVGESIQGKPSVSPPGWLMNNLALCNVYGMDFKQNNGKLI